MDLESYFAKPLNQDGSGRSSKGGQPNSNKELFHPPTSTLSFDPCKEEEESEAKEPKKTKKKTKKTTVKTKDAARKKREALRKQRRTGGLSSTSSYTQGPNLQDYRTWARKEEGYKHRIDSLESELSDLHSQMRTLTRQVASLNTTTTATTTLSQDQRESFREPNTDVPVRSSFKDARNTEDSEEEFPLDFHQTFPQPKPTSERRWNSEDKKENKDDDSSLFSDEYSEEEEEELPDFEASIQSRSGKAQLSSSLKGLNFSSSMEASYQQFLKKKEQEREARRRQKAEKEEEEARETRRRQQRRRRTENKPSSSSSSPSFHPLSASLSSSIDAFTKKKRSLKEEEEKRAVEEVEEMKNKHFKAKPYKPRNPDLTWALLEQEAEERRKQRVEEHKEGLLRDNSHAPSPRLYSADMHMNKLRRREEEQEAMSRTTTTDPEKLANFLSRLSTYEDEKEKRKKEKEQREEAEEAKREREEQRKKRRMLETLRKSTSGYRETEKTKAQKAKLAQERKQKEEEEEREREEEEQRQNRLREAAATLNPLIALREKERKERCVGYVELSTNQRAQEGLQKDMSEAALQRKMEQDEEFRRRRKENKRKIQQAVRNRSSLIEQQERDLSKEAARLSTLQAVTDILTKNKVPISMVLSEKEEKDVMKSSSSFH